MTVRVLYRERQRLTAADLRLEQEYRLGLAGRHHVVHHEWGIVCGLRVEREDAGSGRWALTPGLAIDGYGRELVVPARVPLAVAELERPDRCVLIAYCEDTGGAPGRTCQEEPALRIRQRVACLVTDVAAAEVPADTPLEESRAAGGDLAGRAPWPVLVARFSPAEGGLAVDYGYTRYVRHRAAAVTPPGGAAALQLGLRGASDFYAFAVAARGAGVALERRLAIDRAATVHVWRPLLIAGDRSAGEAALADGRVLRVELRRGAHLLRGATVEGVLDREGRTLAAAVVERGDAPAPVRVRVDPVTPLELELAMGKGRTGHFQLLDAAGTPVPLGPARPRAGRRRHPQMKVAEEGRAPVAEAAREVFAVTLAPGGGRLSVEGSVSLQLRPALQLDPDPHARELHAVYTSKPSDPVPETAVRLCGGALDGSDTSSRLSVGGRSSGFCPALSMTGAGAIDLPGSGRDKELLHVTRTVHLAPIGRTDPLVQELLPLAFIAGLRRMGKVVAGATATIEAAKISMAVDKLPPGPWEGPPRRRQLTLRYRVRLHGLLASEIEHGLETVAGVTGGRDVMIRTIGDELRKALPRANARRDLERSVKLERFRHAASMVQLQVQLLVKHAGATGVVVSNAVKVEVPGSG